ncbi:MAG: hypothetical protein AB1749_09645 [Pseudomonadota bacterium]|jgi:hypothetical protein
MTTSTRKENRGRWELFEQVSTTGNAFIWTLIAVLAGAVALYFLS